MKTQPMSSQGSAPSSARTKHSSRLSTSERAAAAGNSWLCRITASIAGEYTRLAKLVCVWAFCAWFVMAPVVTMASIRWIPAVGPEQTAESLALDGGVSNVRIQDLRAEELVPADPGDPTAIPPIPPTPAVMGTATGNITAVNNLAWGRGLTVETGATGTLTLAGNFTSTGDITVEGDSAFTITGIAASLFTQSSTATFVNNGNTTFGTILGFVNYSNFTNAWNGSSDNAARVIADNTIWLTRYSSSSSSNGSFSNIGGLDRHDGTQHARATGKSWLVIGNNRADVDERATFTNAGHATVSATYSAATNLTPTWVFQTATFNLGTEDTHGGIINLSSSPAANELGNMWLWNTETNFIADAASFAQWNGVVDWDNSTLRSVVNDGNVFFSSRPTHVGLGRVYYNTFRVSGITGGSANLRFMEYARPINTAVGDLVIINTPIVPANMRYFTDNRVLLLATENAQIANSNLYLEGTYGRISDSFVTPDDVNGSVVLPSNEKINDRLLYNVVRVHPDATLGITSNIMIAKIDPERRNAPLLGMAPLDLSLGQITDLSWYVNNPDAIPAVNQPNSYSIPTDLFTDPSGFGWLTYNPAWDPTNNPNSRRSTQGGTPYYTGADNAATGGIYKAFYDPAAAVHNAGNPSAAGYNPTFDKLSAIYNPASSWEFDAAKYSVTTQSPLSGLTVSAALTVAQRNIIPITLNVTGTATTGGHIAYNPYVDANGFSGGWTKVDNGMLWIQTAGANQLQRDINSLIDVQNGTLRFNAQKDLRPVTVGSVYVPTPQYNFNPNGLIYNFYDAAGKLVNTVRDKTNYYTIQLNVQENPIQNGAFTTSTLSTSGGWYYSPGFGDGRLEINNRIILHGGGTLDVGQVGVSISMDGTSVTDDSVFREYTSISDRDNPLKYQGGGVGGRYGYLWLRGATLVLEKVDGEVTPLLTKTGNGVLDLTGVVWEGYTNVGSTIFINNCELNVQNGTLAFTNSEDLGTGSVTLNGRQSILAILKDSTLDKNYQQFANQIIATNETTPGAGDATVEIVDPRRSNEVGWWSPDGLTRYAMNPNAGFTRLSNTINFVDGGTINVVQGGEAAKYTGINDIYPTTFAQPFFSEYDVAKARVYDGYHNQHNLILGEINGVHQIQGDGIIRKIGLGKLTIEGTLRDEITGWNLQRGTLSFSKQENLGAGNNILFTLDKNATLQYMGTPLVDKSLDPYTVTIDNRIEVRYPTNQTTRGGATFDIQDTTEKDLQGVDLTENTKRLVTLKLTGDIVGYNNLLTITKIGQHRSILDVTETTVSSGVAGGVVADWDVRTGELAFNRQENLSTGNILLSEATTLHKVYKAGVVGQNQLSTTLANNLAIANNATLLVDTNARLTLTGNLTATRQLDKLGSGSLILNGALSSAGTGNTGALGTTINGGLRIKEGNLEFSERKNITTSTGTGLDISLYGKNTGIIYNGSGNVNADDGRPNPTVITSNINILPTNLALNSNPLEPLGRDRVANITVTNQTGNLQIDGSKLRGGDLTVNDLVRDEKGEYAFLEEQADGTWKWETVKYDNAIGGNPIITGASTLVKKGTGTLTLTGVLNGDAGEDISLVIEKGKIAFTTQANLGHATNNTLNNVITLQGTGAILEYAGKPTNPANNFSITNTIQLENGGGALSVYERGAVWKLNADQIEVNQTSTSQNWTLAKTGAGILDVSDIDLEELPKVGSTTAEVVPLTKLDIQNGVVRTSDLGNLGAATQISMGSATSSGILEYIGATDSLTNQITLAGGGGINVNTATTLTLAGSMMGTGNFTKSGDGTLLLGSGGNGYFSGDFIVEKGDVNFIGANQKFSKNLIVTGVASTVTVSASNALSATNGLYLVGGSTFEMADIATPISQTLAGVYVYGAANGKASTVDINDNILTLTNTAAGTATWRAGMVTGGAEAMLTINSGYLIADLSEFAGKFNYLGGGGVIDTSKVPVDPNNPNINGINWDAKIWDQGKWISGDVTLTGITGPSHITVGHNPTTTENVWASDNISLTNSTVDIAGTFLTSQLFINGTSIFEKDPNVKLVNSRISVQENWNESGNVSLNNNSLLLVGGKWQHYEVDANGNGAWVDGLWDPNFGTSGGYNYNGLVVDQNNPQDHEIRWTQDITAGAAIGDFNSVSKFGSPSKVTLGNNSVALIRGDWNSGAVTATGNSQITVGHIATTADGTQFLTANTGEFNTNGKKVTVSGNSAITTYGAWKTGDVAMNSSTISVGMWDAAGNALDKTGMTLLTDELRKGDLTITGTDNKLRVAGNLDARNITAANTAAYLGGGLTAEKVSMTGSDLKVDANWNSGNAKISSSTINVGTDWKSGNVDANDSLITIAEGMMAGDALASASVASNNTTWDVGHDWTSANVDFKNTSQVKVGGNWKSETSTFSNVQNLNVAGKMDTNSTNITSVNESFNFNIAKDWTNNGQFTARVNTASGNLNIGGNFTNTGKVYTDGASWNVTGAFNAVNNDTTIANAASVRAANWISGSTTLNNVGSVNTTGDWTSNSLTLNAPKMSMTIGGTFTPGNSLKLHMQPGTKVNDDEFTYNLRAVNVNLNTNPTPLSVLGTEGLGLGKYNVARIVAANFGGINNLDIQRGLFKNVTVTPNNLANPTVVDITLEVTGFTGYLEKFNGGLTRNQLAVVSNISRMEQNILAFENAPMAMDAQSTAIPSSIRNNRFYTDVVQPLIRYGDNATTDAEMASASNTINDILTQVAGETYANSMSLINQRPWMSAYDRTRMDNSMYFVGSDFVSSQSAAMRGQTSLARMNRMWITPEYSFDAIASDDNARAADINRLGFSMGMDRRIRQNATAGIMFGYNAGRLKQMEDRFQASDFQVGMYTSAMVGYYIEMRGYLGCGWQTHESNRIVDLTSIGGNRLHATGKANGSSVSGSLEAARPLFFGLFILKPTMGIDFGTYARDAFAETGDPGIRLHVDRTTYTRVAPRIGATWESGTMSKISATTRLFFGYNLGDEYVDTRLQILGAGNPMQIRSTVLGRAFIDAGIGGRYFVNETRTFSLHANADFSTSKHSFAGALSIGAGWMF